MIRSRFHIIRRLPALLLLMALATTPRAGEITGTVYDEQSRQPVPFATVRVEGTNRSILANENGQYRLALPVDDYRLKFSHIAYYSKIVNIALAYTSSQHDVYLIPALIEVRGSRVYRKRYDPAQQIILRAIARKDELLSRLHDYQFEAYSRIVISKLSEPDSSEIWLIAESQLKAFWQYPDHYKEIIIARKQSANIEAEGNLVAIGQILDFNANRLDLGRYSVVSPTARDALDHYNYYLMDTIVVDSQMVFRLEIEPKSQTDPLFAGFIDIADSSFAVVGVEVGFNEGFEQSFLSEQLYRQRFARFDNDLWMPIEIRYDGKADLKLPGIPKLSFDYVASLYDYVFNATHDEGTFNEYALEVDSKADDVDSAAWYSRQIIPLTVEERQGYERIDSLDNVPKSFSRKALGLIPTAIFAALSGPDWVHFNRVEGLYLGGAVTKRFNDGRTILNLKSGYAFSGEYWQHRYGISHELVPRYRWSLATEFRDQISRRPTLVSSPTANVTAIAVAFKFDQFDYYLEKGFNLRSEIKMVDHTRFSVTYQDYDQYSVSNATEYSFFGGDDKNRPNPAIINGKLRSLTFGFRYDSRKRIKSKGREFTLSSLPSTILEFGVELANPNLIDNDFDFSRHYVRLFRQQRTLGLGVSSLRINAGRSDRNLPPQRYFTVDFGGRIFAEATEVKTLHETNFVGTRAIDVYLAHNFGRKLFKKTSLPVIRSLPFSLIIYGGMFLMELPDGTAALPGREINQAQKAYREVGFGLGDMTVLGITAYFTWQLSDYDTDRFAFKVGFNF